MIISGTAWITASGTKRWLPSARPLIPRLRNHPGLELRAHEYDLSFLCTALLRAVLYCGRPRVILPEGVGQAFLLGREATGRENEVCRGVYPVWAK